VSTGGSVLPTVGYLTGEVLGALMDDEMTARGDREADVRSALRRCAADKRDEAQRMIRPRGGDVRPALHQRAGLATRPVGRASHQRTRVGRVESGKTLTFTANRATIGLLTRATTWLGLIQSSRREAPGALTRVYRRCSGWSAIAPAANHELTLALSGQIPSRTERSVPHATRHRRKKPRDH
jgi:hypothetical protein